MDSPAIMSVIFAAQRFRTKPSDMLRISDGFVAYCFDEACCFIISQMEEGKRPFFRRSRDTGNARTIDLLKILGAEVKYFD